MEPRFSRASRSTTPIVSLPSSATNRRRRGRSTARWSILPLMAPRGILASISRGIGSSARAAPPRAQNAQHAATSDARRATARFLAARLRRLHLIERRPQALGHLLGVVVGPEVHEEEPRLLAEHVVVDGRHLDAVRPQGADHGFTSSAVSTKSPVVATLPAPVAWKLMAMAEPIASGTSVPLSFGVSARGTLTW